MMMLAALGLLAGAFLFAPATMVIAMVALAVPRSWVWEALTFLLRGTQ
jgi:hypothetical protein